MATFDMKKPSTSAEGEAASNFGKKSGKASAFGNALQVGVGIFAGSKGKNPSQGAGGGGGGGSRERSAEDWQNENTMKNYDLDRETQRGDYHYGAAGKNTPTGSKLRKLAADGKGGFSVDYGDVIESVQNQTAGDSTPKPNPSGHAEGKQWSSTGKSKGKKATYADARAAVAGGFIVEGEGIEVSPTYAKKYAARTAAKKAKGVGKK